LTGDCHLLFSKFAPISWDEDRGWQLSQKSCSPLPRHMPQSRKPGKPRTPKPLPAPTKPGPIKRIVDVGKKVLRVKACWDWTCRVAIANEFRIACGEPEDWTKECMENTLDNLERGLDDVANEGISGKVGSVIGRACVRQVRRELKAIEWLRDRFSRLL